MPLSPTVKVDGGHCSRTVAPLFPHCYNYHPFYIFTPSPTLTPVGDPLPYKRRPVCNVEGVRSPLDSAHTLGVASSSSSRAPQQNTKQAGVGFYASVAARTWVNRPCARLDLLSVLPPPSHRTNEGAPAP